LPRCTGSVNNGVNCQNISGRRNWMVKIRRWTF
jgi:hypothetical protein